MWKWCSVFLKVKVSKRLFCFGFVARKLVIIDWILLKPLGTKLWIGEHYQMENWMEPRAIKSLRKCSRDCKDFCALRSLSFLLKSFKNLYFDAIDMSWNDLYLYTFFISEGIIAMDYVPIGLYSMHWVSSKQLPVGQPLKLSS